VRSRSAGRAALAALALSLGCEAPRRAPLTHQPRGVSLGLFASSVDFDYGPLLREIADLGTRDVMLVVPLAQADIDSAAPAVAVPAARVARALAQARALDLRVGVMPIIELRGAPPGQWRGQLRPSNGAAAWFRAYTAALVDLAAVAARGGATRFGVGSELVALEPYARQWRAVIAETRRHFRGRVFYSVNWDDLHRPEFLDAVDEVGVSAYFAMAAAGERPTPDGLRRGWRRADAALDALARRVQRPVFLSEVGYPSLRSAAERPWDERTAAPTDLALQRTLYEGLRAHLCDGASPGGARGFYVWNWFGFGGPTDTGFTPRGKPAAASLRECFAGSPHPNGEAAAPRAPPPSLRRARTAGLSPP
jgi:hypothetical protein